MVKYKLIEIEKISYENAFKLQKLLQKKVISDNEEQYILSLSHKDVITSGKRGFLDTLKYEKSFYERINIALINTDRGGLATFHGDGQLVIYFILNLGDLGIGIKRFVEILETTAIEYLKKYSVDAEKIEGMRGVFVGDNKIMALGLNVKHNVTSHGLALNVFTDLTKFDLFIPCGLKDKGVTSIYKETSKKITIKEASDGFLNILEKNLGVKIER